MLLRERAGFLNRSHRNKIYHRCHLRRQLLNEVWVDISTVILCQWALASTCIDTYGRIKSLAKGLDSYGGDTGGKSAIEIYPVRLYGNISSPMDSNITTGQRFFRLDSFSSIIPKALLTFVRLGTWWRASIKPGDTHGRQR